MMRAAAALLVATFAIGCDDPAPAKDPGTPRPAEGNAAGDPPPEAAPPANAPTADPLLTKVCAAYDAEVVANPSPDMLLARTAARAVDAHGVTEAELATIGGRPSDVLRYIESHGRPAACDGFVGALKTAARSN
jgi:hypothetical protein